MSNKQRIAGLFLFAFSVITLMGCSSYPMVVTSQYVDKPVIIGPYWKVGAKIEDYLNLKKQKSDREFETEVERVLSVSSSSNGYTTTTTRSAESIHTDNISKEILMQNPTDEELIMVKECYVGSYLYYAAGGMILKTFGGVDGVIIPKPDKTGK